MLVTYYFPPLNEVASLRLAHWAKYWHLAGHKVIVITSRKSERDGALTLEVPLLSQLIEVGSNNSMAKGRSLIGSRVSSLIGRVVGGVGRTAFGSLWDRRLAWVLPASNAIHSVAESQRVDYVVSSYGPTASMLATWLGLRKLKYCPVWLADFRDLWFENPITRAPFPVSQLERALQRLTVGRRANCISTVSEPLAEQLRKQMPNRPTVVIPNGVDFGEYEQSGIGLLSGQPTSSLSDEIRIIYTGMIYRGKRDPTPLFQALKRLPDNLRSKFRVEFYGKPSKALNDSIRESQLEQCVTYCGQVPHTEAMRIQATSDLLLLLEWHDPKAAGVMTGKVFEYMASGRPILGVGIERPNVAATLIEELGAGVAFGRDGAKIAQFLAAYAAKRVWPGYRLTPSALAPYSRQHQADQLITFLAGSGEALNGGMAER